MTAPTGDCEGCRWWRERHGREWCAHDAPEHVTEGPRRSCQTFSPRRGEDWKGYVGGNTDTRWNHL